MMESMAHRYRHTAAKASSSGAADDDDDDMHPEDVLASAGSAKDTGALQAMAVEMHLFRDTCSAALLEPLSADDAASFAVLSLDW